jgi:hypothetical protein
MGTTQEFQERVARIEGLVRKVESAGDPALRSAARDLVESLMELHGAGLERMLEIISSSSETGAGLVHSLSQDELVSSLLVLYGIHPEDFETRVRRGLDKVRPQLRSNGARVEIISLSDGVIHARISGAASPDFEAAVREALFETAPDAAEVVIDGGRATGNGSSFVPLVNVRTTNGSPVVLPGLARP